jgi:hypothetical protein
MRNFIIIAVISFFGLNIRAQKPPVIGKYWIEFTDKSQSPFCTCRPWEFLSARSLDRRARAGIEVADNDLPVNPTYIQGLKTAGATVFHTSRWLNAATVSADSNTMTRIAALPFVKRTEYVGRHIVAKNPPNRPPKKRVPLAKYPAEASKRPGEEQGFAGAQNSLLNLPLLYYAGSRGRAIWVTVMDGGFTNVDTMPFFDSIALAGRLIPGWDFVERDAGLYEGAQHGTSVLGAMAANMPGYLVGTAPDATYFLLKTEDTGGEFPVEEANWIAGAEWADSLGSDIINASLGYTVFNDTTLSHTFKQLDGRTTIGSRGASIAATKGMIICNSAGNSGEDAWKYVGVPADAPGIVAVGATDAELKKAGFSSIGPTSDGRIKPDLCAPGDQVVVAGNVGTQLGLSSGTSLASPMLAGAIASLWSADPEKTAGEILEIVYKTSDQINKPDNLRGYGQPDFSQAWLNLQGYLSGETPNQNHNGGLFSFSRDRGTIKLLMLKPLKGTPVSIELRDLFGKSLYPDSFRYELNQVSTLTITGLDHLAPGTWQVLVHEKTGTERFLSLVWK